MVTTEAGSFKALMACYSSYYDSCRRLLSSRCVRGRRAFARPGRPRPLAGGVSRVPVSMETNSWSSGGERQTQPSRDRQRHRSLEECRAERFACAAPSRAGEVQTASPDRYTGTPSGTTVGHEGLGVGEGSGVSLLPPNGEPTRALIVPIGCPGFLLPQHRWANVRDDRRATNRRDRLRRRRRRQPNESPFRWPAPRQ